MNDLIKKNLCYTCAKLRGINSDGYWVRKWNSDSQGVYCETYEDAKTLYNRLTWGD